MQKCRHTEDLLTLTAERSNRSVTYPIPLSQHYDRSFSLSRSPSLYIDRRDFRGNIFSSKHRNLRQIFRRRFFFLIRFQIFCILLQVSQSLLRTDFLYTPAVSLQAPDPLLAVLPFSGRMITIARVGFSKRLISDQLSQNNLFRSDFQKLKCRNRLHMDKRFSSS